MKIKILKSNNKTTWYCNMINQVIDVKYDMKYQRRCFTGNDGVHCLFNDDYVITELPESFCVKRGDDEEKWKKYIQWLNKTCKNDFNGNGVDPYYGLHKGSGCYSHVSFGTEIHIDDMIKHIDFYSEPMVVESKQEFNFNRKDAEILFPELSVEIAYNLFKCLATGTDEDLHECIKISPSSEISKLEGSKSYYEGIIAIKNRFNNYINMSKEFDLTTDEGRLAYAKKHYPIGTEYIPLTGQGTDFSVPLTIDFKPRITNIYGDIKGCVNGLIYTKGRWAEIIKEEEKMETQKLTRAGLKEIHSVACSNWKGKLEGMGIRNPLEDYIELTQEEVDAMFRDATSSQLPIVSKYLKQDDGSVDVTKFTLSGKGFCNDDFYIIRDREQGEYKKQSFLLSERYDWEIKTDELGQLCLIPTKKK